MRKEVKDVHMTIYVYHINCYQKELLVWIHYTLGFIIDNLIHIFFKNGRNGDINR